MNRHVVLKVVKPALRYTETALDEIKLLHPVLTTLLFHHPTHSLPRTHPGRSHIISFLNISAPGPQRHARLHL
jgi:serine/threonine-protein kinase SRPK3